MRISRKCEIYSCTINKNIEFYKKIYTVAIMGNRHSYQIYICN